MAYEHARAAGTRAFSHAPPPTEGALRLPLLREPLRAMEGWTALPDGTVLYDGSESSPDDALWRAFDEGELDRWLLEGGDGPGRAAQGMWSKGGSLQLTQDALCARFDAKIVANDSFLRVTLTSQSEVQALRRSALAYGLLLRPSDDRELEIRVWDRDETRNFVGDGLRFALKQLEAGRVFEDDARPVPRVREGEARVLRAERSDRARFLTRFLELEASIFEPARRDTAEKLAQAFDEGGVAVVALRTRDDALLGFALGMPLEGEGADGPKQDVFFGAGNTLYTASTTLSPDARGLGLGMGLKAELMKQAAQEGYRFVSARNRIGATDAMMRINRRLGAYEVARYHKQYGENASASYFRIATGPVARFGLTGRAEALELSPSRRWIAHLESGDGSGAALLPGKMSRARCPASAEAEEQEDEFEAQRALYHASHRLD